MYISGPFPNSLAQLIYSLVKISTTQILTEAKRASNHPQKYQIGHRKEVRGQPYQASQKWHKQPQIKPNHNITVK
jgi:hypothetical protein